MATPRRLSHQGPWSSPTSLYEIRMVSPRSRLPVQGRTLLIVIGIAAALLAFRFVLLGAWPVLIFFVFDIGALAVALYMFNRGPVPEERFSVREGQVELLRMDGHGRRSRVTLPAFWTRLEASGRTELDHDLWLVFRRERHRIGQYVSADERRALEPRIRAALDSARSALA